MPPWNSAKAKVQLRLSVQRLRTLQQKKEAQAKSTRRDIATLLERGKIETARVKVETSAYVAPLPSRDVGMECKLLIIPLSSVINEDIHVELLELLELYCELLLARFGLLEQNTREPDPGVSEGVCSIIHAAPRTELKASESLELHVLRDILMHKYGREFSLAVMENRNGCVSDRVVRKLGVDTPSAELVDAYLVEIAKGYGIEWVPPGTKDHNAGTEGGIKESGPDAEKVPVPPDQPNLEKDATVGSTTKSSHNALPNSPDIKDSKPSLAAAKSPKSNPEPAEDDFDALAKRFAALKKR
ncbi:regulator of Vps4 activity in the MVB pathway-domain-containing protein [Collybia nuda]|uniref:Regulator of Vps4 activity in the MVB pathway-domain-containing protein n=1 Tax=Collybia nuda TaxID=64659 RepID=A0A9P5YIT2_9AGAR|nr:regulator of Vps4 activity in the MVB pathway-domain-containing protein [Collybia nuda]